MKVQELFDLSGKVAIVTGGSRGLGLDIAEGLGEAGARVVITARRDEWLLQAEGKLRDSGIDCAAIRCDVADPDDIKRCVTATLSLFGQVDVLVNNAGVSWGAPAVEMSLEKWRMVIDTNVTGTFLMTQAVGKEMIRRGQGGTIINVASIAGLIGAPPEVMDSIGYHASKGAVISMARDLSVKWARYGIRVNCIAPGFFPTRLSGKVIEQAEERILGMIPLGRMGQAGEIKGVTLFLASAAAGYITGQTLAVDGGMTAW